ncbi:MAG: hypothetical protein OEZ06_29410 [Myxococcales bacterium]|nr:hypothetical protein [Myxococcales bacterium]
MIAGASRSHLAFRTTLAACLLWSSLLSACGDDGGSGGVDDPNNGLPAIDAGGLGTGQQPATPTGDAGANTNTNTIDAGNDVATVDSGTATDTSDAGSDAATDSADAATDSGDACASVSNPCTTAGQSCDGTDLVTCAADGNGCLVQTRLDCSGVAANNSCAVTDSGAVCAVDVCIDGDGKAKAGQCDSAGATRCDGDSLLTCVADADGCLVETGDSCIGGGNNACTGADGSAACSYDACKDAAGADKLNQCNSDGATRCNGSQLITCAADGDGCLVETGDSCIGGETNACTGADGSADCSYDVCKDEAGTDKTNQCDTDGATRCDGSDVLGCGADGDGCLVETAKSCIGGETNACTGADGSADCSYDVCKDAAGTDKANQCDTEDATRCDGNNLMVCSADPDGCLIEDLKQDCATGDFVACAGPDGSAECVDCLDDEGCGGAVEGDVVCVSNVWSSCKQADADLCLERIDVENCGDSFTCDVGSGCVYSADVSCDETVVDERVLREPGSFGPFDTTGEASDYGSYTCPGFEGVPAFVGASPDLLFALDISPGTVATVGLVDPDFAGTGGWLILLAGCSGAVEEACGAITHTELSYVNEGDTTERVYLVVDADNTGFGLTANPGTFGLTVDVREQKCGDGIADGSEPCDDGNEASGDGCTPLCELEEGWACTAGIDSVCTLQPADGICGSTDCDATLPGNAPSGSLSCCIADDVCGIAYADYFGASCFERDQEGTEDAQCEPAISKFPAGIDDLAGCCRADGACGVTAVSGSGCVERSEAWAALQDGYGHLYFEGPLSSADCTP